MKTHTTGPPTIVLCSSLPDDVEACPVAALCLYITRSVDQTVQFDYPKLVFVTTRKSFRRAHPGTLGHWIKDNLTAAGLTQDNSLSILLGVLVHHAHFQRE